jgi:ribosomal-protein-alanine N-acetyltransferase
MTGVELMEGVALRPLAMSDASEMAAAYRRNRVHLEPWEPLRSDRFFTREGQEEDIAARVASSEAGTGCSLGVFHGDRIVGRFNLAGIVRGPFQSGGLGYWVDRDATGRGIATAAVRAIVTAAREELGLHRLEASTLTHNHASQSVLRKAGFEQIGFAPRYLRIAGRWQDHNLYQVILHA